MNWNEKKTYVRGLVNKKEVASSKNGSRRKFTYQYYLRNGTETLLVCKDLFLSTLGIGEYTLYSWMDKVNKNGLPTDEENKPLQRSEQNTRDKRLRSEKCEFARKFLESLPKLPSHSC